VARLGHLLDMPGQAVAAGIVRLVNENMAAAIRMQTIHRGLDPRDFLLCAFGGAGPLHAAELATILEMPAILVPPYPGVAAPTFARLPTSMRGSSTPITRQRRLVFVINSLPTGVAMRT
jgi:N-methylhydantoinase A/oxoprolinase/acetone carboxylase beta subunit